MRRGTSPSFLFFTTSSLRARRLGHERVAPGADADPADLDAGELLDALDVRARRRGQVRPRARAADVAAPPRQGLVLDLGRLDRRDVGGHRRGVAAAADVVRDADLVAAVALADGVWWWVV